MYYNHNLRTQLQEWKSRLSRSNYDQFGHQLKFFRKNLSENKQLSGIIEDIIILYPLNDDWFDQHSEQFNRGDFDLEFENEVEQAAFCVQFIDWLKGQTENYDFHHLIMFTRRDFNDTKEELMGHLITPLVYYLHDQLDKSNSTVYLLEKYKKRTEWFTRLSLLEKYRSATKQFEDIFEDDLRMFLFDQGIDYPFSTPKSSSGRTDIVSAIDTSDPIVIEIKIVDKEKGYGKQRIKDGFSQIVRYCNDYNKDIGYLVIFNLDAVEIDFQLDDNKKIFPPMVHFNIKTFFFVVINLNQDVSASKIGTTQAITITTSELISA